LSAFFYRLTQVEQLSAHVHGSFSVCVISSTLCGEISRLEIGRNLGLIASVSRKLQSYIDDDNDDDGDSDGDGDGDDSLM